MEWPPKPQPGIQETYFVIFRDDLNGNKTNGQRMGTPICYRGCLPIHVGAFSMLAANLSVHSGIVGKQEDMPSFSGKADFNDFVMGEHLYTCLHSPGRQVADLATKR